MASRASQTQTTSGFASTFRGQADFVRVLSSKEDANELRGQIDGSGDVQKSCSTRYIQIICSELLRARATCFLRKIEPDKVEKQKEQRRLSFLQHEIKRLLQSPALFPSPSVKARFVALLAIDGALCFDSACSNLLIEDAWRNFDKICREQLERPSYLEDSHGWENFLLNEAPGSTVILRKTEPKSAWQVAPLLGIQIAYDYAMEEREILDFIHKIPSKLDLAPARSTLLIDFDNPHPPEEQPPRKEVVMTRQKAFFGRSPFHHGYKLVHDQNRPGPERLEMLSSVTSRLERIHDVGQRPAVGIINHPWFYPTCVYRSFKPMDPIFQFKYVEK